MNRDFMSESKQMVWGIKEHLKKWVEKNKTETNYIAMTPIENYISQIKREDRKVNGSIFTFVNDCFCDIRFVYGKVNDKLQFIIGKKLQ